MCYGCTIISSSKYQMQRYCFFHGRATFVSGVCSHGPQGVPRPTSRGTQVPNISRFSAVRLWQAIVEVVRAVNRNASPLGVINAVLVLLLQLQLGVVRLIKADGSSQHSGSHVPRPTRDRDSSASIQERATSRAPRVLGSVSTSLSRYLRLPQFRTSRNGTST